MIPKKIHQVWVGPKPCPNEFLSSIKQLMPDYEYRLWTNDDLPNTKFVRECLRFKKYALLSDYMRMKILASEGGFYLDTDVEVLKRFDDFLNNDVVIGYEYDEGVDRPIGNAIIGSVKNSKFINQCIDDFIFSLNHNLKPFYGVKVINNRLIKMGLSLEHFTEQHLDGVHVFPRNILHPNRDRPIPKCSYTIHHLEGSWHSKNSKVLKRSWLSILYRSTRMIGQLIGRIFPSMRYR